MATKKICPGGTGKPTQAEPFPCPVTCDIDFTAGKLSITGESYGSGGQIEMDFAHKTPAYNDHRYEKPQRLTWLNTGWTEDMWLEFLDCWHDWHLNDMRAGCEHQTKYLRLHPQELSETCVVERHTWGDKYHDLTSIRRSSKDLDAVTAACKQQFAIDAVMSKIKLTGYTTMRKQLWPEEALQLLRDGFIRPDRKEEKLAAWTYQEEHEKGWLLRSCPECGYRYGERWNFEAVPQHVIDFLNALPGEGTL